MRIITGKYRGRKLHTPEDRSIRPTADKVREALFSIVQNEVPGSVFCDLFAGTGSIGIEALSRGAAKCYFGDSSRDSIRLLKENLAHVGAEEKAVILFGDYHKVLKRLREPVDIFFLDPPYDAGYYENCLETIDTLDLLGPDGIIIAERNSRTALPESIGRFTLVKERKYGKTTLDLYRRKSDVEASGSTEAEL